MLIPYGYLHIRHQMNAKCVLNVDTFLPFQHRLFSIYFVLMYKTFSLQDLNYWVHPT
ncbi:hypothetical protein GLOIN_2v1596174 [Rhizophagus irregularis DAOM 181602=DAOM 197198]|uniref:Uncharacterized protein n=1 Tax=Rhizophagus irregularis (strain DAOM 181602 / DAOM 197198 / MUCL 43194) TaxID=747089 RepID=A0A2P4Q3Y5_RHIID|nr:hypothetical protein GLOIN_2v1596174 [Rhizophagus irregularis DAOM 181602=DAOM 197198]POG72365.1 hypothetical protein GLOIN_2v1596174 [Rhizophagus irregularis DAOM 181602=DAOM 197198]|eukprot:XP_025179231.1 hypothetical protein GLOIN_2v1596174 [Rhizophagus irregularis DAOM 181602=DAOM 197198]